MAKSAKKSKITPDKLARMTANEFSAVRKDMNDGFARIQEDMATRDDLKITEVKILQAVDKIVTKFDKAEKDHAADKLLHDRHEKRLERVETRLELR